MTRRKLPPPDSFVADLEAQGAVAKALRSLTDDEAAALWAIDHLRTSVEDVAAAMGVSLEVCETWRAWGLRKLARSIK